MSAADLQAEKERLRTAAEALRARPLEDRAAVLGGLLDALAAPDSSLRRSLEADLPAATGFSRANVREGLGRALSAWGARGLRELVDGELGAAPAPGPGSPRLTAVVPAGAIPMPTLEAILAPLLVGSGVVVRPAARDPLTARRFRAWVADADADLGAAIGVVDFDRKDETALRSFLSADAIVASGADATLRTLRELAPPAARFVGYGHRFSLAVVAGRADAEVASALALDVSLWDQLGCLSPLAVMALDDADAWADALATALSDTASQLPPGELPLPAAAATQRERTGAELRAGVGPTRLMTGSGWTVVREADAAWRPAPLHRFLRVHPLEELEDLAGALGERAGRVSTVAVHGRDPAHSARLGERLRARLGVRVAAPGACQTPPLHWNHDGIGTLRPLLGLPPLPRRT